ncbi:MAG: hypothetical protein GX410_08380 [Elusimicrobia bacterium]|nr:hypothetical protein [Elusimicrobiota bacterium]
MNTKHLISLLSAMLWLGVRVVPIFAASAAGVELSASAVAQPQMQALPAAEAAPAKASEWTMMVFMSGKNDLSRFVAQDINRMEMAGSGPGVNVVVQAATMNDGLGAVRYHITRDGNEGAIASRGERVQLADMGGKAALSEFMKWAMSAYPAKKYALIIWSHGFGWAGGAQSGDGKRALSPDVATGSVLSDRELSEVLGSVAKASGKQLDLLVTDACGMQMLSSLAELQGKAGIVVGSEDTVPADSGLPYQYIIERLNDNPGQDAQELSRFIADAYRDLHPDHVGVSAVRTDRIGTFVQKLNNWIDLVVASGKHENIADSISRLPGFYDYARSADLSGTPQPKDIFQLVEAVTQDLLFAKLASPQLIAAAEELQQYRGKIVLANSQGDLSGLSEYVPKDLYNSAYDDMKLSKMSRWDDFMKWLLDPQYSYPMPKPGKGGGAAS